jgi:SAM-dependent methyltransferase
MADPQSVETRRFRSTVPYYARYRLNYPVGLFDRIASILGLAPGDRVLDLGTGPGLIAIPFAERGMRVTAVDPEPDMLAAAWEAAMAAGVGIDFREGSSFSLPSLAEPFKLVTIGRAFHWMDRAATLRTLDSMIVPEGAVALFGENHPDTVENAWQGILDDIGERFGVKESPSQRKRADQAYRSDESMLFDSQFRRLERFGVVIRREITADDLIGLILSRSGTSLERLGPRAEEFEQVLRSDLASHASKGEFVEIAELTALIARRS